MKRFLTSLPLSLVLVAALTGCAGTPSQKAAADSGEYEWVTPTGSNIAVRVPKGQKAAVGTSPTGTLSGEAAAGMINSSGGKVPTDKGGR